MHWAWLVVLPFAVFESLRSIANTKDIVWLQSIVNQEVFTHIGNVDNAWLITYAPLLAIRFLNIRNRRIALGLVLVGIVGSIYAVFDEEILALPLFNMGTPDLLDIPAGIVGWICGILHCRFWLKRRELL